MGTCATSLPKDDGYSITKTKDTILLKLRKRKTQLVAQSSVLSKCDYRYRYKLGIFGYIRKKARIQIPIEIIQTIILFADDLLSYSFNINDVLNCKINQRLSTKEKIIFFKNCRMSLICILKRRKQDFCLGLIVTKTLYNLKPINSAFMLIDVSCIAARKFGKTSSKYTKSDSHCLVSASLNLRYFTDQNLRKYGKSFEIYFNFEIIKLINSENNIIYHSDIYLKRIIKQYEWKIDNKLFKKMKNAVLDERFYTSDFDKINTNWYLTFIPCDENGESTIYLYLRKMPKNVECVVADYEIKCHFNDNKYSSNTLSKKKQKFKLNSIGYGGFVIKTSDLYLKKGLKFYVNIKIENIYKYDLNKNEILIPPCDWKEYGIKHTDIDGNYTDEFDD